MKQLIIKSTTTLSLLVLLGCSNSAIIAPSQNEALNSVSGSKEKEKSGFMQNALDSWTKDEWEPTVSADKEIQQKYMKVDTNATVADTNTTTIENGVNETKTEVQKEVKYVEDEDKPFTLQEFVDKAAVYIEATPSDEANSNVKQMESLPVIGK